MNHKQTNQMFCVLLFVCLVVCLMIIFMTPMLMTCPISSADVDSTMQSDPNADDMSISSADVDSTMQ